jgi:predicted AAA+ superfamily ATPase
LRRLIDDRLLEWKTAGRRKPLIIRGGRQVGKTWAVEQLGRRHFARYVKIDLEKRPDLHAIFEGNLESKALLSQLALAVGEHIKAGETLLFLDEIQACPRALMALRYLYEDMPDLHVIAAGSLLEFAFGEISFPLGRVQFLNMYPLTFVEFVLAQDNLPLFEVLRQGPAELSEVTHGLLLQQLKNYFFVGGMPEAVMAWLKDRSMLDAFEVHAEILDAYRRDFAKYAPRADKRCLDQVFVNCAIKVGEQIQYSKLADGFSNKTIHHAFDLLCNAEVLHKVPATKAPGLPLGGSANHKKFKVSVIDIGLMQRMSHLPVDVEMRHDDLLDIYRGKLAEQFVAQELLVTQNRELYYWAREERNAAAEVDYLIHSEGRVYPVEVKSGKGGSLRSLRLFLDTYAACPEGLVLSSGRYSVLPEQRLRFIPLYFAGAELGRSASMGQPSGA